MLFRQPFPAYLGAAGTPPFTDLEALFVLGLLLQHSALDKPPALAAFQKIVKMECELDALLYLIWTETLHLPVIMRHGQRVTELEGRLAKWRDVCLTNRDDLCKVLRATFLAPLGSPLLEALESECKELPSDSDNLLFIGERLRIQLGDFLTAEALDEQQTAKLHELR